MSAVNTGTIPIELQTVPHWVAADAAKRPIDVRTGALASPTDAATWATLSEAVSFAQRRNLDIGYVLTRDGGVVAVDLDHCVNAATGSIEPWAQAIVDRLDSYCEISRSRTGLHVFAIGTLPPGRRRHGRIETYNDGRYIIVTGNALPGHRTLQERTAELAAFHAETFPAPPPTAPAPRLIAPLNVDDDEILSRARQSPKFRRLFDAGDLSDHAGDWSAGDLAELDRLVHAGCTDPEQLDRLHRGGRLNRPKWDRDDYRARTIATALNGHVVPAYHAPPPIITTSTTSPTGDPCGDPCGATRDEIARLRSENARLTRERDDAKNTVSNLITMFLNPHLKPTDKLAHAATMAIVSHKRQRGAVEADGRVVITAAEVANDYRPVPPPGERVATHNGDGSRPRMSRSQVGPILAAAAERGTLTAAARPAVRQKANRSTYLDTEWIVTPAASPAAFLGPAATWNTDQPKERKPRTLTPRCPHCGEVHNIVRKDYCHGCGSERASTMVRAATPPPTPDVDIIISDDLSQMPHGPERAAAACGGVNYSSDKSSEMNSTIAARTDIATCRDAAASLFNPAAFETAADAAGDDGWTR